MNIVSKMKEWFGVQDMTVGKPMTGLVRFSVPLLIGNLAQQLYSTVDSIVVGKYCSVELNGYNGVDALAAIGSADWLCWLIFAVICAIAMIVMFGMLKWLERITA